MATAPGSVGTITETLTPLQSFLRLDIASPNNDAQRIANVCNDWRNWASRGFTSVGLTVDNPPTSTPDYDVGSLYVQKSIKSEIQQWLSSLDPAPSTYAVHKATAVNRLSYVLRQHDRRFLWRVLLNGIKDANDNEYYNDADMRPCSIMVEAICLCDPELAFRSSSSWFEGENGSIIGRQAPVEICITSRKAAFLLQPLLANDRAMTWLNNLYVGATSSTTPLVAALQAKNQPAVQVLLQTDPDQIDNESVQDILIFERRKGKDNDMELMEIARWIIGQYPILKSLWFEATLETRNVELTELYYAPEVLHIEGVIATLILFTAMSDDRLLALEGFQKACLSDADSNCLLHLAVKARRVELARYLAEHTAGAYTRDGDEGGHHALWYNNQHDTRKTDGTTTIVVGGTTKTVAEEIRHIIILKIIHACDPEVIDEVIQESNVGEYSFDLSDVNAHTIRFSDFLDAFMSEEQQKTKFYDQLQFESVLKYVQLPDLPSDIVDAAVEHTEIIRVFEWLWNKGVRQILRLAVPDRLWGSQNEKLIALWVAKYGVEILNWRCQDLSFTHLASTIIVQEKVIGHTAENIKKILQEEVVGCATDNIKEIHLYSSGKSAVHKYWLGSGGLLKFPKIRYVYIHVIEDFLPKPLVREAIKDLDRDSKPLVQYLKGRGIKDAKVRSRPYPSLTHRKVIRGDTLKEITTRAFKELTPFLDSYRRLSLRKRTRVAILDNGIMATSGNTSHQDPSIDEIQDIDNPEPSSSPQLQGNILEHIVDGKSFVHGVGNRRSAYYVAADPHGTQMAALICALDPHCEILVAKVAERRSDIFPDRVAKAIRWAIKQKIDIISMSFVCEKSNDLMGAIKEAQMKNILIFASCHDEGFNKAEAYPAHCPESLAIAACDQRGDLIYNIPDNDYQYRFRGRDVFVGRVAQLDSRETITGSSVATATAAGMASLILSCLRFCERPRPDVPSTPPQEQRPHPGRVQDNQASVADESSELTQLHRIQTNGVSSSTPSIYAQTPPAPPPAVEQASTNGIAEPCVTLPNDSPNSDWRRDWVQHFFGLMTPATDKRYVALDKFCNLHQTDLAEVNFERTVIRGWFCSSRP